MVHIKRFDWFIGCYDRLHDRVTTCDKRGSKDAKCGDIDKRLLFKITRVLVPWNGEQEIEMNSCCKKRNNYIFLLVQVHVQNTRVVTKITMNIGLILAQKVQENVVVAGVVWVLLFFCLMLFPNIVCGSREKLFHIYFIFFQSNGMILSFCFIKL